MYLFFFKINKGFLYKISIILELNPNGHLISHNNNKKPGIMNSNSENYYKLVYIFI